MADDRTSIGTPPRRILVITLRRLGDVLLTTPLVRTLRTGFPGARIDMLVNRGTEGILVGNPDVSEVIAIPEKITAGALALLTRSIWRDYDLAISTQSGDRPTFLAWAAGRRRHGIVREHGLANRLKRKLLHRGVANDLSVHRVIEQLRLADGLGIALRHELVCPSGRAPSELAPRGRYAVLHPNPKYRYKRWNAAGWRELAVALKARGLGVAVTGAPDPDERAYLDELWPEQSVLRLDGKLNWPELAALIRDAAVFVGADTSMTHLAAGTGAPTIAIYGPVDPAIMGPWPVGCIAQPWRPAGTIQRRGNVWVVQNPLPCLPCERLGCDGHLDSRAQCLDELAARQVLVAVDQALVGNGGSQSRTAEAIRST
jgi:heptosyltransferase-3